MTTHIPGSGPFQAGCNTREAPLTSSRTRTGPIEIRQPVVTRTWLAWLRAVYREAALDNAVAARTSNPGLPAIYSTKVAAV